MPRVRLSPYTKRWWTRELTQCRTVVRQLTQKAYKRRVDPHDPVHQEYKMIRNPFTVMIEIEKASLGGCYSSTTGVDTSSDVIT